MSAAVHDSGNALRFVDAVLNYLGPMPGRPLMNSVDPSKTRLVVEPVTVTIRDARALDGVPSLDREGFTLVSHRCAVRDFRHEQSVRRDYPPDVAALIKTLTGAAKVIPSATPILRYVARGDQGRSRGTDPAARIVHADYTDVSARYYLAQVADPDDMFRRYSRIALFQVWRALSGPPQDVPLAICDSRTTPRSDLVTADSVMPERSFSGAWTAPARDTAEEVEFTLCRFHPAHRWYYYSSMRDDEVLVFKGFDTDSKRPSRMLHSAFDDPDCPPGAPPRLSVEARAFAFFD